MRYQNANTDTYIEFEGKRYPFLSFIYQGATRTRTGDNIEAALALAQPAVNGPLLRHRCYRL